MAITKCLHMKQAKTGYPAKHLANGLRYIMDKEKTEDGRFVCGHNCIPELALAQMVETKKHFGKLDKRQGYHFIVSFEEDEISEEEAFEVVGEFVKEFLGEDFEAVYAVHNDTDHIHGHIIFNSVRCTNGYKYDYKNGDWEKIIQPLVNRLCEEHGLSVLDLEEVREKRKVQKGEKQRNGEAQKKTEGHTLSKRDQRIKKDVDQALQDAGTYEEFMENLSSMGYEIRGKKRLSVREPGAGKARRLDQLGDAYTEAGLRMRIGGLFIPEISGKQIKMEWTYLFIPYRERHLTRYQKERFIRRYREGKQAADSKTWRYKAAIQELRKLQEEFDFLAEHRIQSKKQLEELSVSVKERLLKNRREWKKLQKEMQPYKEILHLLDQMEETRMEAGLYQEGYAEFAPEYQKYQELQSRLESRGYSLGEAEWIDACFFGQEEQLRTERKTILKEKRIAERLCEKAQKREVQQKEIQKKENGKSAKSRGNGG